MNALDRPGPMKYIPSFIARKHGKEKITYDIPIMEKYLKDTYGITVYQEQVMLLSRMLANFTRKGESDAFAAQLWVKKLRKKLDELKPLFISGGEKNLGNTTVKSSKKFGPTGKTSHHMHSTSLTRPAIHGLLTRRLISKPIIRRSTWRRNS